jgi:hypothetical protein
VVEEIISWVEKAIDTVASWTTSVFGFSAEWPNAEQVVIKAFRAIGVAGAYVFDTLAARVGVVAVGVGKLIEGLGFLASRFKDTLKDIADTGAEAQFKKIAAASATLGASITDSGKKLEAWGQKQIDAFGTSPDQFNKWLDNALKPKQAGAAFGDAFKQGIQHGANPQ